jgi:5-deoxy-D-glucuronate isomerase
MSELIIMCFEEEEERIKAEKPDFAYVVIDSLKLKKNKDNDKDKNKTYMILVLIKQVCLIQDMFLSVIIVKKYGYVRKDCKKFKN